MAVNLPVGLRARHPGKQSSPHLASLALMQAQAAKMKDTVLRAAKLDCGIRACIYWRVALGVAKPRGPLSPPGVQSVLSGYLLIDVLHSNRDRQRGIIRPDK
jgi:hypothetical protein